MTLGKRISDLRKQNSYSQEYVAERMGVSRQAVSKWEQDQSAPDTYNLIALADLLGVTVEYLATGKESGYIQPKEEHIVKSTSGTQRIVGFILLTTGILALILGLLFSQMLIIISVFMLLCAILCLAVKKNIALAIVWLVLISHLILTAFTTGRLFIFTILNSISASGGAIAFNVYSIIILLAFVIISIVTIIKIIKGKRK